MSKPGPSQSWFPTACPKPSRSTCSHLAIAPQGSTRLPLTSGRFREAETLARGTQPLSARAGVGAQESPSPRPWLPWLYRPCFLTPPRPSPRQSAVPGSAHREASHLGGHHEAQGRVRVGCPAGRHLPEPAARAFCHPGGAPGSACPLSSVGTRGSMVLGGAGQQTLPRPA